MRKLSLMALAISCLVGALGCGGGSKGIAPLQPPPAPTGEIEGYVYVPIITQAFNANPKLESPLISRQAQPPAGYQPLPGSIIRVEIKGVAKETQTDQFGHFKISGLPEGTAQVTVSPPPLVTSPILGAFLTFTTTMEVKANTTAYLGPDGKISLISSSADHLEVIINQITLTNFPQLQLMVSVLDPVRNSAIIGLELNNFELEINRQRTTITQFSQSASSSLPAAICLVLDVSGSMAGPENNQQPLTDLKQAGREFINYITPADRVEIISFSDDVQGEVAFTNDKSALWAAIDRLDLRNFTALYDAITFGIAETALQALARKAVIVMTDGGENASQLADYDSVRAMAVRSGIPVYIIGLQGADFSREAKPILSRDRSETELQAITQISGGEYFYAPQSSDLMGVYTKITQRKQQQYTLGANDPQPTAVGDRLIYLKVRGCGLEGTASGSFERLRFDFPVNRAIYLSTSFLLQGFYEGDSGHLGEDIDLPEKAAIRCIGDGKIVQYEAHEGYGELAAVVEHDLGSSRRLVFFQGHSKLVKVRYFCSIYGHIRASENRGGPALGWKVGNPIKQGQVIGYINDDAHNGIGPEHLHMGIRLTPHPGHWAYYGYEDSKRYPESSVSYFAAFSELMEQLN